MMRKRLKGKCLYSGEEKRESWFEGWQIRFWFIEIVRFLSKLSSTLNKLLHPLAISLDQKWIIFFKCLLHKSFFCCWIPIKHHNYHTIFGFLLSFFFPPLLIKIWLILDVLIKNNIRFYVVRHCKFLIMCTNILKEKVKVQPFTFSDNHNSPGPKER